MPLVGEAYGGGNRSGSIDVAATLTAKGQRIDFEVETFIAELASTLPAGANSTGGARQPGMGAETAGSYLVAHTPRGEGFDASEDGTGRGIPLVPVALRGHADYGDSLPSLRAEGGDCGGGSEALIAFQQQGSNVGVLGDVAGVLPKGNGNEAGGVPCIAFDPRQSDVLVHGDITGPLDTRVPGPAIAFSCKDHSADAADEASPTLRAMGHGESHPNAGGQVAVAYGISADALDRSGGGAGARPGERSGLGISEDLSPTLKATRPNAVASGWAVRRLTEDECARLQGFPDGWSRIPWRGKPAEACPGGPQYKTYGNSMATKKMRWLAQRLAAALAGACA